MSITPVEKVEWRGIENLVAAEVLTDTDGEDGYTTGPVFQIAGVAELSKTTESSSETHYYDNIPAIVVDSTGADQVNVTTSAIPLEILAKINGQTYDEELGVLLEGERESKYFAMGYKTQKTNGTEVYVWRYKGTFSIPDSTHTTKNDSTDANGQELVYTGISTTHAFTKGGRVKAINVDTGKNLADVSTFFDTVTTPDSLKAKTAPGA